MIIFDLQGKRLYSRRQNLFDADGKAMTACKLTERQSDEISR